MQDVIQGLLTSLAPDPEPQSINTFTIGVCGESVEAEASAVTVRGAVPFAGFTLKTATGAPTGGPCEAPAAGVATVNGALDAPCPAVLAV